MPEYDEIDAISKQQSQREPFREAEKHNDMQHTGLSRATRVRLGLFEKPLDNPRKALKSTHWDIRAQAITQLAQTGNKRVHKAITTLLTDTHSGVRAAAIRALGITATGSQASIESIVKAWNASSSKDVDLRIAVLDVLAKIAPQLLYPDILNKALGEREDEEVRLAALHAAATLGEQVPIKRLVELLRYDSSWRVREQAGYTLAALGDSVLNDFFFDALYDRSEAVVSCSIKALQQRHSTEYLVQWLLSALREHAVPLRSGAATVLGILREQGIEVPMNPLLTAAHNDPFRIVRKAALFALGRPGEPPPEDQLVQAVKQETDRNLRFVAWCILETWYPHKAAQIETPAFTPRTESTQHYGDYVLDETSPEDIEHLAGVAYCRYQGYATQEDQKFLIEELVIDKEQRDRFRADVIAFTRLHHPHILPMLDFGVKGDTPYWVLPYIHGATLKQRYDAGEHFSVETILTYIRQLASALSYAHERYILHLNIRPEHILFNEKQEMLLGGFQIADHLYRRSSPYSPGILEKACPQTDQYYLAALTYEWFTGDTPPRFDINEGHRNHLPSVASHNHELKLASSTAIDEVFKKALSPQDFARYPSVQTFVDELTLAIRFS